VASEAAGGTPRLALRDTAIGRYFKEAGDDSDHSLW